MKYNFFKILSFSFFISVNLNAQSNEWRTQYVKWHLGINYNLVTVKDNFNVNKNMFTKLSGTLSVDVALAHNDVFDSSALYIQPNVEISVPVELPYNKNLKYSTYSGGVNVKKHFNVGNFKSNLYLIGGGKIELINWRILYSNENSLRYTSTVLDYVVNIGAGYVIVNQLEFFTTFSHSLSSNYYTSEISTDLKRMNSLTFGLRFGLSNNWWFSKK